MDSEVGEIRTENRKCKICGKECKNLNSLSKHIKIHKIKNKEYYDKFLKKEGEKICLECRKETNFNGLGRGYCKFCSCKCKSKNKEVEEKRKNTCIKNFGAEFPYQNKEIQNRGKQTYLKKHGVEHYNQTPEGRQICREICIKNVENQKLNGEPLTPVIGKIERIVLNEIQQYSSFNIRRNPKIFNYFPDGLIKEKNLKIDIEYDEGDHKYQLESDKRRDECFISHGYKVFRIKESQWKENKQLVIEQFKQLIGE